MRILKQSTQIKVPVGPMVDATDGATLETAISWATGEAALIKNDDTAIVNIGTNTWSAHLGGGMYNVTLTASNTDTLGLLVIVGYDAAARPSRHEFMVVPSNVYDSMIGGTDLLQTDVTQINGNVSSGFLTSTTKLRADVILVDGNAASALLSGTTAFNADVTKISGTAGAADNLEASALGIVASTASTGGTLTNITTNLTESTNDHYNGRTIIFTSGVLTNQAQTIVDYNGTTKAITVAGFTEAASTTDAFVIV